MSNFPKHFIDAMKAEECILFIGSGISAWSGLPTWKGLIKKMLEFLRDHGLQPSEGSEIDRILLQGDLPTAASLCKCLMRKEDFRNFIDDIFIKSNPKPHEIHKIIVDLGPDSFITTNYDRLIDDAYQGIHNGSVLFPVNNDQPIELAQIVKHGASRFVFTPHGRAEKCDTIIMTREDYRCLRHNSERTIETLHHLMISRPVVYLGFGLRDPDFLMIKDQIAAVYRGGEREHFAVMPNVSDLQKRFWREQYGINILSYNTEKVEITEVNGKIQEWKNHDELLSLLQNLQSILKKDLISGKIASTAEEPIKPFAVRIRSSVIRYCEDIVHTFSSHRLHGFPITANFREDLSLDLKLGDNYETQKVRYMRNIPILELLDSSNSLTLIGPPGSGKTYVVTTYAAMLAERTSRMLQNTQNPEDKTIRRSIPLVLSMKEYSGDIKEMIASRLPRSVNVNNALECGCLVLIFDALNEVPRELVEAKVLDNDILWLCSRFPRNKFIFTSRTMNYASFLPLPIFELQPISVKVLDHYLQENCDISVNNLSDNIIRILTNPLFLGLFIQTKRKRRDRISNAVELLKDYFSRIEWKLIQENKISDFSLTNLLAPIAYLMIDKGSQTILPEQILAHFHRVLHNQSSKKIVNIFHALISLGIFVPDVRGEVGFFHQTTLEYLAALELRSLFQEDSRVLEEKINFFRWDETIMLFISLLPSEQSELVLRRIAKNDILFACQTFKSAAVREQTIGLQLFDIISEKLKKTISEAEKKDLARAISNIGPYGRKKVLMKLLDDQNIAGTVSIVLARMQVKEAIPKIIELLLNDNIFPSNYAKALRLFADRSYIPQLIEYGKQAEEDGLLDSNIGYILSNFESDFLYSEISKLVHSKNARERQFAAEILGKIDSDRSIGLLTEMLSDSDYEVLWRVIFGLRWGKYNQEHGMNSRIVSRMFELLAHEKVGYIAAKFLRKIINNEIIKEVMIRLQEPHNEFERINLCAVIAKFDPKTSKRVLFDTLDNFNPSLHRPLYSALASLGIEHLAPDIFVYLKSDDPNLRLTVLETLRWALDIDEQLPISREDCEYLLTLWENSDNFFEKHIVGGLLSNNCSNLSKEMLLKRIEDVSYNFREQITGLIARLPLVRGDLSTDVIDWLITELSNVELDYIEADQHLRNPVADILGKVCDEKMIIEKLVPLLNSNNEVLRNDVYVAVIKAERMLGKRFIKK